MQKTIAAAVLVSLFFFTTPNLEAQPCTQNCEGVRDSCGSEADAQFQSCIAGCPLTCLSGVTFLPCVSLCFTACEVALFARTATCTAGYLTCLTLNARCAEDIDNEESCPGCESPIILPLGTSAYELTSVSGGVRFDLENTGILSQTAWTGLGAENAFLALDRNGNSQIDSGAELFGNHTPLLCGGIAQNGFEALVELDDNRDAMLDSHDQAWCHLLLWTDRNHDGFSGPDEIEPISNSAVTALELRYRWVGRRDRSGNSFRFMSHFRVQQGVAEQRRTYYDVFLRGE